MRRWWLAAVVAGLPVAVVLVQQGAEGDESRRFEFSRSGMGTEFRIALYADDPLEASEAATAAFARVAELDLILSDYRSDSELSRLAESAGSGRDVRVSEDLWSVLAESQRWARRTGGAFDVTIGPLTRLWRWARRREQLPPPDRLKTALRSVGYAYLALDSAARSVRLERPGMGLDLGGIAKGYAADAALATLREHGITRALVDAGGDVVVGDPPTGRPGWRVEMSGLDDSGRTIREVILLTNAAIATSGGSYQSLEVDGVRYSHIVDPRTGLGLTHKLEVTVVASTGIQADALASAISVLGAEDGLRLAQETSGVEARILEPRGDNLVLLEAARSRGFPSPEP